jgi:hypothetical protein
VLPGGSHTVRWTLVPYRTGCLELPELRVSAADLGLVVDVVGGSSCRVLVSEPQAA